MRPCSLGENHHQEHVLREAIRLHFHDDPPQGLADWLAERGID